MLPPVAMCRFFPPSTWPYRAQFNAGADDRRSIERNGSEPCIWCCFSDAWTMMWRLAGRGRAGCQGAVSAQVRTGFPVHIIAASATGGACCSTKKRQTHSADYGPCVSARPFCRCCLLFQNRCFPRSRGGGMPRAVNSNPWRMISGRSSLGSSVRRVLLPFFKPVGGSATKVPVPSKTWRMPVCALTNAGSRRQSRRPAGPDRCFLRRRSQKNDYSTVSAISHNPTACAVSGVLKHN